jgi:hypothetical protein
MATLRFPAAAVLTLVQHTLAARSHERSYFDEAPAHPQLVLVKDDGIYVMSNGLPPLMADGSVADTEKPEGKRFVVYAVGFDPGKDQDVWERARLAVGGDDFAEYLDLWENATTDLAAAEALLVDVTPDQIRISTQRRPIPRPRRSRRTKR